MYIRTTLDDQTTPFPIPNIPPQSTPNPQTIK